MPLIRGTHEKVAARSGIRAPVLTPTAKQTVNTVTGRPDAKSGSVAFESFSSVFNPLVE